MALLPWVTGADELAELAGPSGDKATTFLILFWRPSDSIVSISLSLRFDVFAPDLVIRDFGGGFGGRLVSVLGFAASSPADSIVDVLGGSAVKLEAWTSTATRLFFALGFDVSFPVDTGNW